MRKPKRKPVRKLDLPEVPTVRVATPPAVADRTPEEKAAEDAVRRMVEAAYT